MLYISARFSSSLWMLFVHSSHGLVPWRTLAHANFSSPAPAPAPAPTPTPTKAKQTMLNSSTSLPSITSPLLPFTTFTTTPPRNLTRISPKTLIKLYSRTSKTLIQASSSSESQSAAAVVEETSKNEFGSASDIVRNFYGGINEHHLDSVAELIAENCVYEDLVFPDPFVGRKAILEFFKKFTDSISKDLQFVIDDISGEDSLAVGVTWHLEWQGRPFPFSKGCSFYRLEVVNGKKQIIYGRDSVEPSVKPGETALVAIRGVTWLFQRFPQLAEQLR